MTGPQRSAVKVTESLHDGVRWAYVGQAGEHEAQEDDPPVLIQWRYHQAVRSQMVFGDGHKGPMGESAVYV